MASGLPAHMQGIQGLYGPHAPRTYTYPQFFQKVVPFVKRQEAKSPYYRLHYVFVHEERRDFLDLTGTLERVLAVLDLLSQMYGIPVDMLFEKVTVFGTGRNALDQKVDPLLAEGYKNIAMQNVEKMMDVRNFKGVLPPLIPVFTSMRQRERAFQQLQQNRMGAFEASQRAQHSLPSNILEFGIRPFMLGTRTATRRSRRGKRSSRTRRRR